MRVMLVDDNSLFLEGLQYLLETYGIEVVGTAQDGEMSIKKTRELKPDIILMDIKMPNYSGLETLRAIKTELPDIKIVMLTTSDDDEDLITAIRYGAAGYLLKNSNAKELVGMLSLLEKNEVPLSPGMAKRLLEELRGKGKEPVEQSRQLYTDAPKDQAQSPLTEQQLLILELVAQGVTYKEVGETLGLSERTIKYHMERIIEQLHLTNRSQAIAYAVSKGLFTNK